MNKFKFCDVGRHSVPVLFHSRKKDRPSCCKNCYRPKVGDIVRTPVTIKEGKEYQSTFRVTSIQKSENLTRRNKTSISELLKLAEVVFNKWIRNRDTDDFGKFICISCGKRKDAIQMDAGHYYPKRCSFLRFNENNVHGECQSCNRFHDDHLDNYAKNLLNKIGELEVTRLQLTYKNEQKWSREELLEIIKKYKL